MSGAYKSEKGYAWSIQVAKNKMPWSIQPCVWSIQGGVRGAYSPDTFSGNTKSMDPSVALSPAPRKREHALSQLLGGIVTGPPPAPEYHYIRRRHSLLVRICATRLCVAEVGELQTPRRNCTIGYSRHYHPKIPFQKRSRGYS